MKAHEVIEKLYHKYDKMDENEKVNVYEKTESFFKDTLKLEAYEKEFYPIAHYYFYNMLQGNYIISYMIEFEKANKEIKFYKKVNENINYFDGTKHTDKPINLFFKYKKLDEKYIKL